MPRVSATRPGAPGSAGPRAAAPRTAPTRARVKKSAPLDRLSARRLFARRLRKSVRPGLWVLGAVLVLGLGSELFRAIPALGPVLSPAGTFRHGFGDVAAMAGFRVARVEINGAETTPLPVIDTALGIKPGDPILGFSLVNAAARIAALGPVQSAVVERALPDTLIVTVTERSAFAVWQTADAARRFVVIDKAGNVIADQDAMAAKRRDPGLLLLSGADAPQNANMLMTELTDYPAVRARVAAAERVDGLRWNLILQNRTVVKLPSENTAQAIAELNQLQSGIALLDRPVELIDLRMSGRLVVRPYPAAPDSAASVAAHT